MNDNDTQVTNLNESFKEVNVTPLIKKRKSGDRNSSNSSRVETSKERKTEQIDKNSNSASSKNANSNKSGMKPKAEETTELQASLDSAQLRLDKYAQEV